MSYVKTPERIWADVIVWGDMEPLAGEWNFRDVGRPEDTEFVRVDLYDDAIKQRDELQAEVDRLRGVILEELEGARREADADLEGQAAMERVMDYPMERTYTPAMKRADRLNAALSEKKS